LLAAVVGLYICVAASPASAQVITLRYSNFFPAPHKNSILAEEWCKEVEKVSNGKVKICYMPGAALTPPDQTYDSVSNSIADIGLSLFGYTMGKFPMMLAVDLPMGYKSAYATTKMINAYYAKFKPKELDDVKALYLSAHGPGILSSKKPVTKLEDVKAMKIRATDEVAQLVEALGGAPVGMPMTGCLRCSLEGCCGGSHVPCRGA
jgi:TRAP-type C4-dicarboxylate transport system substrate-binding protein